MARRPMIQVVESATVLQRKMRRPRHPYSVRTRPWAFTPFLMAPVLPGETMKKLNLLETMVSDPVKSKLVGWFHEHHFFYVKHRDFDARDALVAMHLTGASLSSIKLGAASVPYNTHKGGVNFLELAVKRITEEFARHEGEAWNTFMIGSYPAVHIGRDSALDSLIDDAVAPTTGNELQDPESDTSVLAQYTEHYNRMRQARQTNMSFDDWLKMQGVSGVSSPEPEDFYAPERLRSVSEFVRPTNTVEPTTGIPSTALVHGSSISINKDFFFKEPGFIIGMVVSRPKVYLSRQPGQFAAALDEARLWLPSSLADEAYTSLKEFATGGSNDGPLGALPTNGYWIDMRDLFLYGDQFVNFDIGTAGDGSAVALPTAALQRRYADSTMADALFSAASPANQIRMDGVVDLHILGNKVGADQT